MHTLHQLNGNSSQKITDIWFLLRKSTDSVIEVWARVDRRLCQTSENQKGLDFSSASGLAISRWPNSWCRSTFYVIEQSEITVIATVMSKSLSKSDGMTMDYCDAAWLFPVSRWLRLRLSRRPRRHGLHERPNDKNLFCNQFNWLINQSSQLIVQLIKELKIKKHQSITKTMVEHYGSNESLNNQSINPSIMEHSRNHSFGQWIHH